LKNKTVRLIVIIVTIIVLIDQISKILVTNFVTESIGSENFRFEVTNNTGLAFGFNEGNTKNAIIMIFVFFLIIKFIKQQFEQIDKKTAIALSLVLGGGISNFFDRVFRGGVLDFIKIYKFPIFNIADVIVIIGWLLLVIFLIDFTRK